MNRDLIGGKLDDLVLRLEQHLAEGRQRVVLDNTYPTRLSRAPVIEAAMRYNVPVRCRYLQTSMIDAQINIAQRMIEKYCMPLGPDEMKMFRKVDPTLPPPLALSKYSASFEPPEVNKGFAAVDVIPFRRRDNPACNQ